jgi:predicted MFS family arabinose efflux permease
MSTTTSTESHAYRTYVLVLLILIYAFNFLDRQIVGILAGPIMKDLGLSKSEMGLMGGIAFAALYSTLAIPLAWLADRRSRVWIMTSALTIWSGFTVACGFATSFWPMFAMRMGVGVGEAGGVAPAYSLISDYFPPKQRARALAAFSFGIPLGMALGILLGGLLAAYIDWRWAFISVGLAGLVLAPIFRLTVRDPVRGGLDPAPLVAKGEVPSFGEVCRTLLPKRSFWLLAFAAAGSSVCGYGVAFWLPTLFMQNLGLNLAETSWYYSGIVFIGGIAGIWLGGVLADRMGAADRGAYARVPAYAYLVALPFFFLALNSPSLLLAFPLFLVPTALNLVWLGPVITAVQHLVPPSMRATASAMFLLVNNLLGIGLGTYYFGLMADLLEPQFGTEAMRYSIYSGGAFYLLAALLMFLASRTLQKDWKD